MRTNSAICHPGRARYLIVLVSAVLLLWALAADLPLPARPPKPQTPSPQSDNNNIFAAPGSSPDVVPQFLAPNGRPLSTTKPYRLPDPRNIAQLPALKSQQRHRMNQIVGEFNRLSGQVRQQIGSLEQQLGELKVREPSAGERQAQLKQLRDQMKQKLCDLQTETFASLYGMLDDAQRKDYDAMRHGALVVQPVNSLVPMGSTAHDTVGRTARAPMPKKTSFLQRWFHRCDR